MLGPKRTGNWAEDMGNDISFFLKLGIGAIILVPILLLTVIVLLATR